MRSFMCCTETFTKIVVVIAFLIVFVIFVTDFAHSEKAHAFSLDAISKEAHEHWSNTNEYDAFEIKLDDFGMQNKILRLVCIKHKKALYGSIYVISKDHPYLQPLFEPDHLRLRIQTCQ